MLFKCEDVIYLGLVIIEFAVSTECCDIESQSVSETTIR